MPRPIVFVAYSNSRTNPLPALRNEMLAIWKSFLPHLLDGYLEYICPPVDTGTDELFDTLSRIHDGGDSGLTVFHYSGHADVDHLGSYLDINDGALSEERFWLLFSGKKPDLVFLNGCSTNGFVNELLKKGVKAVIATARPVGDKTATLFATAFYSALTSKGCKLLTAFDMALGKLRDMGFDTSQVHRGSAFATSPVQKAQNCPWGLFYDESTQETIQKARNWSLIRHDPTGTPVPKELTDILERVKKLQETAESIREKESLKQEMANTVGLSEVMKRRIIDDYENDIGKLKNDLNDLKGGTDLDETTAILNLYRDINNQIRALVTPLNKKNLVGTLKRINYLTQFSYIARNINALNALFLDAFVLQGSPDCGLEIFQERLIESFQIQPEVKESVEILPIEASGSSFTSLSDIGNIWEELADSLRLSRKMPKEQIIRFIYKKNRTQHILIVFKNAIYEQANQKVIGSFWPEFTAELKKLLASENKQRPDRKILLFLLDKGCALLPTGTDWESDHDPIYRQSVSGRADVHILPGVRKVKQQDIINWSTYNPVGYPLDFTTFQEDYVLPTLREICGQISRSADSEYRNDDLYKDFFGQYTLKL
ncbi:CHAT domain-containing protein [Larkinella sp.]|uniref:CHAT domain-containing protein n=1 Tax=Larkinella sp. TaxID=2034517 RepID=UPI003BAA0436